MSAQTARVDRPARARRTTRRWSLLVAVVATVVSTVGTAVLLAPAAAAYPSGTVSLTGHGYGHGEGMGQWGAFGYAYSGWTWQQIVTHYYSGSQPATLTPAQEGTWTTVALTENDGNDLIVTSDDGFSIDGVSVAGGQSVLMQPVGGGVWDLFRGAAVPDRGRRCPSHRG